MSAHDDNPAIGAAGIGTAEIRRSERGAGSILALAVLAATVLLTSLVVAVLALLADARSVANAADAAALAAADTASGAIAGFPCEAAEAVATLNETAVTQCMVIGLVASVSVRRRVHGIDISASARAGPPAG
ncbi:Rv3654c family TadE-like protein [Cryobacterium gelidum]|uniref:Rv3654c family TadE-like protein n=1 Tax=Cryobacterium gelidum TaxID=1259164 RepID=UPI001F546F7C|nr:Rv3654c family TadE-like protein [Cryobacterium gelidum]